LQKKKEKKESINNMMKTIRTKAVALTIAIVTTLGFMSVTSGRVFAINDSKATQQSAQENLVRIVRASTERLREVPSAEREGYHLLFGCVPGPDSGAMGLHFAKQAFLENPPMTPDGEIDPTLPQIVIYEPIPGGGLRLIGADYLLFADAWDKAHPG